MLAHVDGIDVNYEQRGSGWPVLMLHGGYLDHRHMMDEMEPAFFDLAGWHRLYPDLPAHGRTPTLARPMTFDALLDHVIRFGFFDSAEDLNEKLLRAGIQVEVAWRKRIIHGFQARRV